MQRCLAIIIFLALAALPCRGAELVEKVVAVVNDNVITLTDVEEEIAINMQFSIEYDMGGALNAIIEKEIVASEAYKLGIEVSLDEVTSRIVEFEETFPSHEDFNLFLERQDMDIHNLSQKLAYGLTVAKVRSQKDAISDTYYDKWLDEAKKKAYIKILDKGKDI